ncbi:MAG: amino acid adenylation domain-containing protein, partial [Ktedonobacteraceae bacterium]
MQPAALKGFRLSLQQARLWSLQQNQVYRAQCSLLLEGELDIGALQQALQQVVRQHAILRTVFHLVPGMEKPIQVVTSSAEVCCPLISLENLDGLEQAAELAERFRAMREEPFDLAQGPLFRVALVSLSASRHVLLLSLPALCADAATLKHLVVELSRAYAGDLQGEMLAEEQLQYVDVSAWQDELLQEEGAEEQRAYWRKIDLAQLNSLQLPFTRVAMREHHDLEARCRGAFAPQRREVPVEGVLQTQVRVLTQRMGISVEAFLLTCWQVLLWRLTAQSPSLIGVACDGRHYEELATALGLYTRIVPFRTHLTEDQSFERVLTQVNLSLQEAVKRQAYFTWEEASSGTVKDEQLPFFPVSFGFEDWPTAWTHGPVHCCLQQCSSCMEPFALKLNTLQVGETLSLELYYDPARFSVKQIERLAHCLHTLLHSAVSQPQARVGALELLTASEQKRLLQMAAQETTEYPSQPLYRLFEAQVERAPSQLAVISGSDSLSYEHLNRQANQLAHFLQRQGVGPNVPVGLCVERSVSMLIGLLAIWKAGGAYVPLDPEMPAARLAYQLQDIQAPFLLTQQHLLSRLPIWPGQAMCLDAHADWWAEEPSNDLERGSQLEDLAYVIYTSGSTGVPRGVLICQQSVVNYAQFMLRLIAPKPGLHFATVSTLAADLGNTAIFCSLASGGCLHVLAYETVTSGQTFANYVAQHPLDVLKIVPSHLSALLNACPEGRAYNLLPRRFLVLGGEALMPSLLERVRQRGGSCCVINHYGPTETTIGVLVNVLGVLGEETQGQAREGTAAQGPTTVPIGRPIANSEAYILDRHQQVVPVGVIGELYLGGVGLAVGYLHQEEQTRQRFVLHPFRREVGARLYKTGDLARYTEDGLIEFVGRGDNQVKLRGYRIELGEIEAVLGRHANVRECVVLLREEEAGEGHLVAYVVARQQPAPTSQELRNFVGEQVPTYMVPSAFVFLRVLPLTANGKVDRSRLPAPEQSESDLRPSYVAPRSLVEEVLVGIWQDILKVKQVGIHDNFSNLGGHSLLATQLISRVRSMLQVEIPVRGLFEAPTVAGLAKYVEEGLRSERGAKAPPLVPVSRGQALPLSFAQQRLWFLDQLEPGSSAYNIPHAARLSGKLDARALEQSIQEIVRRHENLRTTFSTHEGQPVQVIGPAGRFHLSVVDLSKLPSERREAEARQLGKQGARQPFDLAHGPLLRTILLRLGENEHVLLLTTHHIISDGWSNGVFVRELAILYNAFMQGQPSPLPELPLQYADFAAWQRRWLQGEVLESQVRYWTERLQGITPLELPTDHPRPAVQTFRGAIQSFLLPVSLSEELQRLSQREGVTLFMTLLAAFQVLLARYSGQSDIAVGTPIANRTRTEIEGLIGFFVNTLVLRSDLSDSRSFLDLLKQVREACLGAYAHQEVPFEKLVEVLQPERDLSRSPLFQVMLVLQNTPPVQGGLANVRLQPFGEESTTAKFDLNLTMMESEQGLLGTIEYNTDLFEASTIARLLGHFHMLLAGIVAQPTQWLATLPLLTANERSQLLHTGPICPPGEQCLPELVEGQVECTPDAIALGCGQEQVSYQQLNGQVNTLARVLVAQGLEPEEVVAVLAERSIAFVTAMLAIWKAGGVYLPLDPQHPALRLAQVLKQSAAQLVLTTSALLPTLQKALDTLPAAIRPQVRLLEDVVQPDVLSPNLPQQCVPSQLAYVIYTSGSTGIPKGVMVEHRGMLNHMLAKLGDVQLKPKECIAQNGPQCFDIAVWQSVAPLLIGGRGQILPDEIALDPARLVEEIEEQGIAVLQLVPSMLRALLTQVETAQES